MDRYCGDCDNLLPDIPYPGMGEKYKGMVTAQRGGVCSKIVQLVTVEVYLTQKHFTP